MIDTQINLKREIISARKSEVSENYISESRTMRSCN